MGHYTGRDGSGLGCGGRRGVGIVDGVAAIDNSAMDIGPGRGIQPPMGGTGSGRISGVGHGVT